MITFYKTSFILFILTLSFVSASLALADERVDRESLLALTKNWKSAAIYSLSSDGNVILFAKLKGENQNMEIPMGKLEYDQYFGGANKHKQDLLFIFIVHSEANDEGQGGLLQTRTSSKRIISFGEKDEIMKSKSFNLSLLIGKSNDPLEKRVFTVPQLIESMAERNQKGTDKLSPPSDK